MAGYRESPWRGALALLFVFHHRDGHASAPQLGQCPAWSTIMDVQQCSYTRVELRLNLRLKLLQLPSYSFSRSLSHCSIRPRYADMAESSEDSSAFAPSMHFAHFTVVSGMRAAAARGTLTQPPPALGRADDVPDALDVEEVLAIRHDAVLVALVV